ncbi:MAG: tail fiber domain-containing protein [Eubacterium sp.]
MIKENITEKLNDDLNPDNFYNLPIKQYNYKPEYKDCELVSGTQIGITAEDVDKFYPNACIYNKNGEPESWQDRIMIPAMLKLIQEQKQEIESLKQRLDKIEKEQRI